jgi:hypothetical protein
MAKKSAGKPPRIAVPIPEPLPKPEMPEPLAKPSNKTTSPEIAHLAGIALQDPNTPEALRGIIASDLAQAEGAKKEKPHKK